jgi:ABC-type multidrug transport system ATPase subunit
MNDASRNVVVDRLSVHYGKHVRALDEVELSIGTGLFGLLGPNGAGKTTLMRTLATLQPATRGSASILGYDIARDAYDVRRNLGYLPQDFRVHPRLRAWEALDYFGILNQMVDRRMRRERLDHLLEMVGLTEFRNRRVGHLSGGMLRRLGVAQALLSDPPFVILDEPTAGLDPAERVRFRTMLTELSRERIVILSTHIVADIGSSCRRLAVLDRGSLRFLGERQELLDLANGHVWQTYVDDEQYEVYRGRYVVTRMIDTPRGLELRFLSETRPDEAACEPAVPNLEDAYLWILNRGSDRDINRASESERGT